MRGLNENSAVHWEMKRHVPVGSHKSVWNNLCRYLQYFIFAFVIFVRKKKYQRVIAFQQFYGIILAFYCAIFRCKRGPQITILTFIYKRKQGVKGKVFHWFVNKALQYQNIKRVVVLSRNEVERYSEMFPQIAQKLYFAHFGLSQKDRGIPATKGDYFLSAGRSNRDYDFLIETFREIDDKLVIISDTYKCLNIPSNVEILDSCYGIDYECQVAGCYAVVISLCDEPISSGQSVVLNAYRYKKPVIVTRNLGIVDYIDDGKTGIIIDKRSKDLLNAIGTVKDSKIYDEMVNQIKGYSEYDYGKNIALAVSDE